MTNAFKADLFYGASGLGKTAQIGKAAEWAAKKWGKRTRLISADGGGWDVVRPHVNAGLIVPFAVRGSEHFVETIDKLCQGYWPADPENPLSPLEPPTVVAYELRCRRCIVEGKPKLIYGPAPTQPRGVICPTCKGAVMGPEPNPLALTSMRYPNPKNDLRDFALIGIEGLTSIGDSILEYLMKTSASLSQDPSYKWTDGDSAYSGGNMTYYGFAQNRLYEFVHKSHMIPYVNKVIWTALEGRGEEEGTKVPIFGPSIAGKKATGKATQWFGNSLHFELLSTTGSADANQQLKIDAKPIIYVRNHADAFTKIPFQAKIRVPMSMAKDIPDFVEADVEKLYNRIDELMGLAEKSLENLLPKKQEAVAGATATVPQPQTAAATPTTKVQ